MTRTMLRIRSRPGGRRALLTAGLLTALVAAPYIAIDDEPDLLDDEARRRSGGRFVRLSHGYTWYESVGDETAQPIVLVHGTTVPSFVWDRNVDPLARAGLRVIRYDLYGRGWSDRVDVPHGLDLYATQLHELLAHVAPDGAVDLAGFSIGGTIVADYARRHPGRVRRVALLAPAGVGTALPLVARLAMAPGVGEYVMRVMGSRQLRPSARMFFRPDRHPGFDERYLATIRFRGSRRAVLDTLRRVPYDGFEPGYQALGDLGKPVLVIWGRHDLIVHFAVSDRVRAIVRPERFVAVEDAGHLAAYEQPAVVNEALAAFLREP